MRTLFSLIILLAASACMQARAQNCQNSRVLSIPESGASLVYIGDAMPKNGCFVVSVKKNGLKTPQSEMEAVNEIVRSLPDWMYVAIGTSYGDTECVVLVNKLDYFDLIVSMWVERWRGQFAEIPDFLKSSGIESDEAVDKLQEKVCKKIKSTMPAPFEMNN